ncbi:MAG: 2-polyprenyl-6-methoxyphenol hydroxylase-like oxidoreductase [Cyanobacteria bacterium]|nr:2-polyprenyl-6-methoxyphenol hydroxylase-like oxidoreductase [Cyanobacteriota bacterium]
MRFDFSQGHLGQGSQPVPPPPQSRRAIVLGGGMSGLLAARVLADHFDQVAVLDRDGALLTAGVGPRTGAPQGDHVHVLLAKGLELMERWFPGLTAALDGAGAPTVDWTADCRMMGLGGWNPRFVSGLTTRTCSRNLLESLLRDRLGAYPQIEILAGLRVEGLVMAAPTEHSGAEGAMGGGFAPIAGVRVRQGDRRETLAADLVIDATGRGSQTPQWLEELGYGRPPEQRVDARLGYASRWYQRPDSPDDSRDRDWKALLLWAKPPHQPRAGVLYPVEGDRWVVTVSGVGGDYPPADAAGFDEFLGSLRDRAIYDATRNAKPIGEPKLYRGTANRWRRYDRLTKFPQGLIVTGDAVCAFNPLYGQGMTAAALGAELLETALQRSQPRDRGKAPTHRPLNLPALDRHFRPAIARALQLPWLMATGEDLRWPSTQGATPSPLTRLLQRYLERVLLGTDRAPLLHETVWRVQHMVASPLALLHPRILLQALGPWGRQPTTPHNPKHPPTPPLQPLAPVP